MKFLAEKFLGMWMRPVATLTQLRDDDDLGLLPYIIFVLVMGLVSGFETTISGLISPPPGVSKWLTISMIGIIPAAQVLGSLVGAGLIWGIAFGLLNGTGAQYKKAYQMVALIAAFSPVAILLSMIPKVGSYLAIAINIWATIVTIRGIIIVLGTKVVRTWVVCGVLFALMTLFAFLVRNSAQSNLQNRNLSQYEDLGADDLGPNFDEPVPGTPSTPNAGEKAPAKP